MFRIEFIGSSAIPHLPSIHRDDSNSNARKHSSSTNSNKNQQMQKSGRNESLLITTIIDSISTLIRRRRKLQRLTGESEDKEIYDVFCPAVYALLSDGLVPSLNTIFGTVPNTLWRVVEGSLYNGKFDNLFGALVYSST